MTTRSEAAKKGHQTRRRNAAKFKAEQERAAKLHTAEAERHWANMSPKARETAAARGFQVPR